MKRKHEEVEPYDSDKDQVEDEDLVEDENEEAQSAQSETSDTKEVTNFSHYLELYKKDPKFRFVTTQTQNLSILATCLASIFDQVRIVIDEDGIVGTSMDSSHTTAARWVFRKMEMVEGILFPPSEQCEIEVDIAELSTLLQACAKADKACISLDNDADPESLFIESTQDLREGNFRLSLMIPDQIGEIPPITYYNRVTFPSDEFNSIMHTKHSFNVDTRSRRVQFHLTSEYFSITFKSGNNNMEFKMLFDENSDPVINENICTPMTFKLSTILNITRITKATKFVTITMPERRDPDETEGDSTLKPMCISYQLAAMGTLSFFVAPYTEDGVW